MTLGYLDQPAKGTQYRHGKRAAYRGLCRAFTTVPAGAPEPAKCSTSGCRHPSGFDFNALRQRRAGRDGRERA